MGLKVETPPAVTPVTLEEAQRQARGVFIGQDDPEAGLWSDIWIPAATARAESFQSRAYITTEYRLTIDWCWPEAICLPRAPVQSVDAVTYVDEDGATQTLDPAEYQFDLNAEPVYIRPAWNKSWPNTRSQLATVQVVFTAGYGDEPADVPAKFRAAVLLMAASLYEYREEVVVGTITATMPKSAENLLWPDRLFPPGHEYGVELTAADLYPYLVR